MNVKLNPSPTCIVPSDFSSFLAIALHDGVSAALTCSEMEERNGQMFYSITSVLGNKFVHMDFFEPHHDELLVPIEERLKGLRLNADSVYGGLNGEYLEKYVEDKLAAFTETCRQQRYLSAGQGSLKSWTDIFLDYKQDKAKPNENDQ